MPDTPQPNILVIWGDDIGITNLMLRFAGGPGRPALRLLVHHDDGEREFADSTGADRALAAARDGGWTVVSVRDDWTTVFADLAG